MSKSKTSISKDFENPLPDEVAGRGKGILATLLVLSLVGLVIWFFVSNQDS